MALAIGGASLYFIALGVLENTETIADFSVVSVYVFLFAHLSSLGIDQYVIAGSKTKLRSSPIELPLVSLLPILIFPCVWVLLVWSLPSHVLGSYLQGLSIDSPSVMAVLMLAIIFCVYGKFAAAVWVAQGMARRANMLYLGKAAGLLFSVVFLLLCGQSKSFWWVILCTELSGFLLVLPGSFGTVVFKRDSAVPMKFLFSGANVFSFEAVMKADLLLLSWLGFDVYLIYYALASSVFEGFVQLLSSFRYRFSVMVGSADFAREFRQMSLFGSAITLFYFPAALLFIFVVTGSLHPDFLLTLVILQVALMVGVKGIVGFHYLEIKSQPERLFALAILSLTLNLITGWWLTEHIGGIGVAFGTLLAFTLLTAVAVLETHDENNQSPDTRADSNG